MNDDKLHQLPERRGPARLADELSRERMARYLPAHLRGVIDKLPPPTSPAARFVWTLAMRYAIRTNGRGWFKSQAQARLAEMMAASQEQNLEMARSDPEFLEECKQARAQPMPEEEGARTEVA